MLSPGYPGQYPHNADCSWVIVVDPGKTIQFHFAVLNIETHRDCGYDKLGELISSVSSCLLMFWEDE